MKNYDDTCRMTLWHSPVAFAEAGHGQDISAAVEYSASLTESALPPRLKMSYTPAGESEETLLMTPCDSFSCEGRRFEIYSAHIPASRVKCGRLGYSITLGDERHEYSVEVLSLPKRPPLIITELFIRPKDGSHTAYVELYGAGDEDVDLYDWELILTSEKTKPKRYPLALERGTVLHSGELAVWWPILAANFDVGAPGRDAVTPEALCAALNSMYTPPCPLVDADAVRIIPVEYYKRDAESGKPAAAVAASALPTSFRPWRLRLVPRGGALSEAVYSLDYNTEWGEWDSPARRSSSWTVDLRAPERAVSIAHTTAPTPGRFDVGQAQLDPNAPALLLLPISPLGDVYIGDGELDIAFAAISSDACRGAVDAWVMLRTATGESVRISAAEGEDGIMHATVPAKTVERLSALDYSLHATDGSREVALGGLSAAVFDNAGPRVTRMLPTEKYAYDGTGSIVISADIYDISGVRVSDCRLEIDGKDFTRRAKWCSDGVKLELGSAILKTGAHTLKLTMCDMLGNRSEKRVRFSVSDMSELFAYRGEVHSHTGESDGVGTPDEAYRYARKVGGADYFAVTDHSHHNNGHSLERMIAAADRHDDPGRYAALYGYEMTWNMECGYWGHMNVLGGSRAVETEIFATTLPELYDRIAEDETAVAMFNHPGYEWGNFDEYAYLGDAADEKVCLAEIRDETYDREYAKCLAAGWHVGPISNEDNHSATWTTLRSAIGFVLAPALTRENVMDAFRARRTYTASEPTLKIKYRINGEWLGSRLCDPERLDFDISVTTEDAGGIGRIEIVGEDNIVVAVKDAGALKSIEWHPTLAPEYDYYYLRLTAPGKYSVTAPVWVERTNKLELGEIETGASYSTLRGNAARVRVSNANADGATTKDVRVAFYLAPVDGFDIRDEVPFSVVYCGDLGAGESMRVSRSFPSVARRHRLTAVATALVAGERRVMAVSSTLLSPVTIAEVLPFSMPIEHNGDTIDDPFPYVVLCNSSSRAQELGGMSLRLWKKTGKAPAEPNIWRFPAGCTIEPRTSLVVWVKRSENDLTVADFNACYGTSFAEGKDIIVCDKPVLSHSEFGCRLELVGDDVMSRVHWNYGMACDGDAHRGRARRYAKRPGLCATSAPLGLYDPCPGRLDEEQLMGEFSTAPTKKEKRRSESGKRTDEKRETRRSHLKLTDIEAAAMLAAAGGLSAFLAVLCGKEEKRKNKRGSECR